MICIKKIVAKIIIIIGPWLLQSTCIIFDRWETLKKSFRDNQNKFDEVNIIKFDEEHLISNDFYNFTEKMESHSWNHNQVYRNYKRT